ncbi:MAG: LPS assembly protein LptD [Candidatus Omnitrophota bacterium]
MRFRSIVFLGLFIFSPSLLAWAEDAPIEQNQEGKVPIVCHGDKVEFLESEQKIKAIGHVLVIYEGTKITCDKMDISMATKEGIAEGDVTIYQKDSVITGDTVEYNFDTQTGVIHQAGFASQLVYGQGPKAVKEGPKTISMNNSYMTTCELADPHYRIQSRTVKIYLEDKVVMKHVIIYVFNVPTFYLPYYSYSLKEDKRPKVTILPGKDKDWGFYLLTGWRYEFSRYLKGILHLDYRERRDFASGFDNYYDTLKYGNGFVKTYYMNERFLEGKRVWDDPRITHERERYMIHQRHSWEIDPFTDMKMEYWSLSDTAILQDYFQKSDFEREPTPESYISIIRTKPKYSLSFLAKRRFNKIFDRTEYQPEIKLNIPSLQIGSEKSKFYWASQTSLANISHKEAHPSNIDQDTVRFDTYNDIKRVSKLGFLYITPYIGGRETYYSKDKYGEHDWWRGALYAGVTADTKFYRVFNTSTNIFGIDVNNLRHVITPIVSYSYIHTPTIVPPKLYQFDGLDGIDRQNQFAFSLENKLQTKRKVEDSSETRYESVDLARLTVSTNYSYRLPTGSCFSNVNFDMEFTPFKWLTVEFDTAYDHRVDRFDTFSLDLYADQSDKWKYGAGYRYVHEQHSEVNYELSFKPTPLWKIGAYGRYILKGYPHNKKKINSLEYQEYSLVRDLHCWTAEVLWTIERDAGESLMLVMRLKAFPELPLEAGTSYHRPKEGSQNYIR